MTTEISKNEKQRERKIGKEKNRISKNCGQLQRYNIYAGDNQKEKKERRTEHKQYLKQ